MILKTKSNFQSTVDILVHQVGMNQYQASAEANKIFKKVKKCRESGEMVTVEDFLVKMVEEAN